MLTDEELLAHHRETMKKVLEARVLTDRYRQAISSLLSDKNKDTAQERISVTKAYEKGLNDIGFKSYQEFSDFNMLINIVERMKCFQGHVPCDGCKGRERACYPGCLEKTGGYNALTKAGANITSSEKENVRKSIDCSTLDSLPLLKSTQMDYHIWRNFEFNGPPGCSVRYAPTQFTPRFDIYWGMPPGKTLEEYEKEKAKLKLKGKW